MKVLVTVILVGFLTFLTYEIVSFTRRAHDAEATQRNLEAQLEQIRSDRAALEREYDYAKRPENMEKELRARFNYRGTGEKMIIIVPAQSSTGATAPSSSAATSP